MSLRHARVSSSGVRCSSVPVCALLSLVLLFCGIRERAGFRVGVTSGRAHRTPVLTHLTRNV